MTLEELKEHRRIAWLELQKVANTYHGLEPLFREVEQQWIKAQKEYRDADYQVALLDGRRTLVEASIPTTGKSKKTPDLTEEQIMELAKKLGIDLEDL